jgi:glycerophosphoryl diester phosphodiesterase
VQAGVRVLAIAHRAGNSLSGLQEATSLGVDVVEADVHAASGRLEVRHSKSLAPLPWLWDRPGPVRPPRRPGGPPRQRRVEWVPRSLPVLQLEELLGALDPAATLMADLKGAGGVGPRTVRALEARAQSRGAAPVLLCGRWWPAVDAVGDRPWARPVLTARKWAELLRLRQRVRGSGRPYAVSVHRSLLTAAVVSELHERVERVMTWPVNSQAALDEVLSRGVRGVISDESDVLRAVLEGA